MSKKVPISVFEGVIKSGNIARYPLRNIIYRAFLTLSDRNFKNFRRPENIHGKTQTLNLNLKETGLGAGWLLVVFRPLTRALTQTL